MRAHTAVVQLRVLRIAADVVASASFQEQHQGEPPLPPPSTHRHMPNANEAVSTKLAAATPTNARRAAMVSADSSRPFPSPGSVSVRSTGGVAGSVVSSVAPALQGAVLYTRTGSRASLYKGLFGGDEDAEEGSSDHGDGSSTQDGSPLARGRGGASSGALQLRNPHHSHIRRFVQELGLNTPRQKRHEVDSDTRAYRVHQRQLTQMLDGITALRKLRVFTFCGHGYASKLSGGNESPKAGAGAGAGNGGASPRQPPHNPLRRHRSRAARLQAAAVNQAVRHNLSKFTGLGDSVAAALGRLAVRSASTLTHLDLSGNNISNAGLAALGEALSQMPAPCPLTTIELGGNGTQAARVEAQARFWRRGLERRSRCLCIRRVSLSEETSMAIASLLPELKMLQVSGCNVASHFQLLLARQLEVNLSLTTLNLHNNNLNDEGLTALAKSLEHNPTLQVLTLRKNPISTDGIRALCNALQSSQLPRLREVDLHDPTLETLLKVRREFFQPRVDLHDMGLSRRSAPALAIMINRTARMVQFLDLSCNRLGPAGVSTVLQALLDVASTSPLQDLDVSETGVDDSNCTLLAQLIETHPHLKSVNVQDNHITNRGARLLDAASLRREERVRAEEEAKERAAKAKAAGGSSKKGGTGTGTGSDAANGAAGDATNGDTAAAPKAVRPSETKTWAQNKASAMAVISSIVQARHQQHDAVRKRAALGDATGSAQSASATILEAARLSLLATAARRGSGSATDRQAMTERMQSLHVLHRGSRRHILGTLLEGSGGQPSGDHTKRLLKMVLSLLVLWRLWYRAY